MGKRVDVNIARSQESKTRNSTSTKSATLCLCFSRVDPSLLAVGGEFSDLWLPRVDGDTTGDPVLGTERLNYGAWVADAAFSPNGKLIAAAGYRNQVIIWDLATHECLQTLRHTGPVLSLSFGIRGSRMVSGGRDGTLRLHQVKTGLCVRETAMTSGELRSLTRWGLSLK